MMATFASGDAGLMACRAYLETWWITQLTDPQRAAWLAYFLINPPRDAAGRTYQVAPRTNLQTTVRPAPTVYAWAMCWRLYYLNWPPLSWPPTPSTPTMSFANVGTRARWIALQCTSAGTVTPPPPLLWYWWPAPPAPTPNPQSPPPWMVPNPTPPPVMIPADDPVAGGATWPMKWKLPKVCAKLLSYTTGTYYNFHDAVSRLQMLAVGTVFYLVPFWTENGNGIEPVSGPLVVNVVLS